jgi:hypothetical protein
MEALLDAPEALTPAAAPAFFSKIFQNLRLSSAASELLAETPLYFVCEKKKKKRLTSSSKHLTVRAQAAVEDTALMGRDLDSSDEGGVAPDAERVIGKTA